MPRRTRERICWIFSRRLREILITVAVPWNLTTSIQNYVSDVSVIGITRRLNWNLWNNPKFEFQIYKSPSLKDLQNISFCECISVSEKVSKDKTSHRESSSQYLPGYRQQRKYEVNYRMFLKLRVQQCFYKSRKRMKNIRKLDISRETMHIVSNN